MSALRSGHWCRHSRVIAPSPASAPVPGAYDPNCYTRPLHVRVEEHLESCTGHIHHAEPSTLGSASRPTQTRPSRQRGQARARWFKRPETSFQPEYNSSKVDVTSADGAQGGLGKGANCTPDGEESGRASGDNQFIQCSLGNVAPKWNEDLGVHVMEFHDNRVTEACEGNFLLVMKAPVACLTERGRSEVANAESGKSSVSSGAGVDEETDKHWDIWQQPSGGYDEVLQCGRVQRASSSLKRPARFNVDFRGPLSPIQAFSLCIANSGLTDIRS